MIRWLFLLALAGGGVGDARPALQVDRVVVMMRHGVRPPTSFPPLPSGTAAQAWPDWPVAAGWLTPHGAQEVERLAAADRAAFGREGLVPGGACPAAGAVRIVSDGTDERTIASGDAYAKGFASGCPIVNDHGAAGRPDPLFAPLRVGLVTLDPRRADAETRRAIEAAADRRPAIARRVARLNAILCGDARAGCGVGDPATVAPMVGPARRDKRPGTTGAFDLAVTGAQALLLEYADGKPMADVGWGRAHASDIAALSELHAIEAQLVTRPPYIAARIMARLAPAMLDALTDDRADAARVLVLAGHDTDVSALGGMLDLHWHVPGVAADEIPPGSAILLERLTDRRGRHYVRAAMRSLALDDIRSLAPSVRPVRQMVPIPGCRALGQPGLCTIEAFTAKFRTAMAPS